MRNFLKISVCIILVYTGILISGSLKLFSYQKKDFKALLEKVVLCPEVVNYWGIKEVESYRGEQKFYVKYEIIYLAPDRMWTKYIKPDKHSGREIIRKNKRLYTKDNRNGSFTLERGRYPTIDFEIKKENLKLLFKNYKINFHEGEIVSNRENTVFEIESRTCKKPRMKVWVDDETGLVMKFEKYFGDSKMLSYWFDEIKINPTIDTNIFSFDELSEKKSTDLKDYFSLESIEKEVDFPVIKSKEIAFGYVFYQGNITLRRNNKIVHLLYTDGLNNISIFINRLSHRDRKRFDEGEINIRTERGRTVISKIENDVHLSLIGGLEKKDMMQIFFSLNNVGK